MGIFVVGHNQMIHRDFVVPGERTWNPNMDFVEVWQAYTLHQNMVGEQLVEQHREH